MLNTSFHLIPIRAPLDGGVACSISLKDTKFSNWTQHFFVPPPTHPPHFLYFYPCIHWTEMDSVLYSFCCQAWLLPINLDSSLSASQPCRAWLVWPSKRVWNPPTVPDPGCHYLGSGYRRHSCPIAPPSISWSCCFQSCLPSPSSFNIFPTQKPEIILECRFGSLLPWLKPCDCSSFPLE